MNKNIDKLVYQFSWSSTL